MVLLLLLLCQTGYLKPPSKISIKELLPSFLEDVEFAFVDKVFGGADTELPEVTMEGLCAAKASVNEEDPGGFGLGTP